MFTEQTRENDPIRSVIIDASALKTIRYFLTWKRRRCYYTRFSPHDYSSSLNKPEKHSTINFEVQRNHDAKTTPAL